ncbi:MAG: DUF1353 domain-containing protein [Pseudomonadota bacterium]
MADLMLLPVVKPDKNKLEDAYEVAEDVATKQAGATIRVPKFFQFDGASIPPLAWQLIGTPFQPRFMTAAVFHDWLYHTHQLDRDSSDALFYALLVASGVRKTKAALMLGAVQSFGDWYWENDKDDRDYLRRLAERIRADDRDPTDYGMS